MSVFWLLVLAIPLLATLLLCWPLLWDGGRGRVLAVMLALLVPAATLLLYQGVGSPGAVELEASSPPVSDGQAEMSTLVAQLRARLEDQPDDVEGWLLLGRSHKALQQYPQALEALRRARELAPADPLVAVELAEALIFTASERTIGAEVRSLLSEAVAADPQLQKGLWLQGIVAFQDGDYAQALDWWQRLDALLEPGSGVAASVARQMDEARTRLGLPTRHWPGLEVTVSAPEALPELPPSAVLFVIAREAGVAEGPPLGAARVARPVFPARLRLDDGNSMLPQRPISAAPEIEVYARLSFSGQPTPGDDDLASEPVLAATANPRALALELAPGN